MIIILKILAFVMLILLMLFLVSACVLSSRCSREEEKMLKEDSK